MFRTLVVTVVIQYLSRGALAFPSKAGSCRSGGGVGGSHLDGTNGALTEGGYRVLIDSEPLDSAITKTLEAGKAYNIVVDGATFKGFLIKLSGKNGTDASSSLTMNDGDSSTQVLDGCEETATALCHTSNDGKSSASGTIMHSGKDEGLTLEVTVVKENNDATGNFWYYAPFPLQVKSAATPQEILPEPPQPPTNMTPPAPPTSGMGDSSEQSSVANLLVTNLFSVCVPAFGILWLVI